MSEDSRHPNIDPKLEARIVALVLGEASDFERDELEQLVAERPELQVLQNEIEQVSDALQVIGQGELPKQDIEWKLPKDKRENVIATLEGKEQEQVSKD